MLEIFGFEWVTWGYITAVFLLLVLLEVIIIRFVREGKEQTSKRWSLKRAALWGLLVGVVVFVVQLISKWAGIQPELSPGQVTSFGGAWGYLIGNFALGPILFVIVAAIRNAARGLSADENESREWGRQPTKKKV